MKNNVGESVFFRNLWAILLYSVHLRLAVFHLLNHVNFTKDCNDVKIGFRGFKIIYFFL